MVALGWQALENDTGCSAHGETQGVSVLGRLSALGISAPGLSALGSQSLAIRAWLSVLDSQCARRHNCPSLL
jgi:hypothetical protein